MSDKARLFVSWSGNKSKEIAKVLAEQIQISIQHVKTFYSEEDIRKGTLWRDKLNENLTSSTMNIVCLTNDNLKETWVHFEAGFMAGKIGEAFICPIIFDSDKSSIAAPLGDFQATSFDEEDFKKLFLSINDLGKEKDAKIDEKLIAKTYKMFWREIKEQIDPILQKYPTGKTPPRSQKEILEDILNNTRRIIATNSQIITRTHRDLEMITSTDVAIDTAEEILLFLDVKNLGIEKNKYLRAIGHIREYLFYSSEKMGVYLGPRSRYNDHDKMKDFYFKDEDSRNTEGVTLPRKRKRKTNKVIKTE